MPSIHDIIKMRKKPKKKQRAVVTRKVKVSAKEVEGEKGVFSVQKEMPNHIQDYFAKEGTQQAFHSRELFKADKKDIDLKTDVGDQELVLVNKLFFNDMHLMSAGIKPIYADFLEQYLRLKISKERKSRMEFVQVNKSNTTDEALNIASSISNITNPKK